MSFLVGPSGKISSMRVNTALVLVTVLFLMVHSQVTGSKMPELSSDYVLLIVGAMGAHTAHKYVETRKDGTTPPNPAT